MRFTINNIEYKLYFKYSEVPQTIRKINDTKDLSQTIISHGTLKITEVIIYNVTHDFPFTESMSECEIFDKYDKRLGMNLAIRNLLKDLNTTLIDDVEAISQHIKETWFNFKKNEKYKHLIQK